MTQYKHLIYIQSLLKRFLQGSINGEELEVLFNYYCSKYFDWVKLDNNDILIIIEDLNEALLFYEANPLIRKQHGSYFGDGKLKKIVLKINKQLDKFV